MRRGAIRIRAMQIRVAVAMALLVPAILLPAAPVRGADDAAVAAAQTAARAWLATVDGGTYGPSWDHAAAYFRGAIGKADWERTIAGVRGPLGRVLDRQLRSATFARTLPGAPDGEYVVIQYDTRFEHRAAAVETVTPMHDPDGSWRV